MRTTTMRNIISSIICVFLVSFLMGQTGNILITNGTVITITDGVKENTDVLISNGKITKIGKDLKANNKSTRVIDATNMYVMPGIIDAHSHIALDVVNEATNPVLPEISVGDALDPFDVGIYQALAGGVTISHAMHGSANAIGGQCETIKHRYGTYDPEEMRMQGAPRTIKFALGENPMRVHGEGRNVPPRSRMGMEQEFRRSFAAAKLYKEAKGAYASGKIKTQPDYDLRMETLEDILDGEIIIHCHSYRADEIMMFAEFGAHASVFADWWAYKFEVYYSTAYNAAILAQNGVVTSINSDSGELIRHLYHEAAKTQRYGGLSDNDALKLITLNPAIQLGIDKRVGSLEVCALTLTQKKHSLLFTKRVSIITMKMVVWKECTNNYLWNTTNKKHEKII